MMRNRLLEIIACLLLCIGANNCLGQNIEALVARLEALARQGNAEAQYHLGMFANNGIAASPNSKAAFEWFSKSAAAGNPLGAYKLGCYFAGQFSGVVPSDRIKALEYKLIAAKAGYSLAQYDAGIAYYELGRYKEALEWWEKAAQQGYPMALYHLSVAYRHGEVTAQNKIRAYAYFKLAKLLTEQTVNPRAQQNLDATRRIMSAKEYADAEALVANWKSQPTEITRKASQGIEAAQLLTASR